MGETCAKLIPISSNYFNQKRKLCVVMDSSNNTPKFQEGDSQLLNHYRKYFSDTVVEEFRRIANSDDSFEGHKAFISKIEAYVQKNVKYDSKEDYHNLVDTLKFLAENDV